MSDGDDDDDDLCLMFQDQLPGSSVPDAGVVDVELYHLPAA